MRSLSTSTTTDRVGWRSGLTVAVIALKVWFVGLSLATLFIGPGQTVVVLGPSSLAFRAAARSDVAVLDGGAAYVLVRSDRAGFVRDLYANGAWLVWPAMGGGCISLGMDSSGPRASSPLIVAETAKTMSGREVHGP